MTPKFSCLFVPVALAAAMPLTVAAQEYSNGGTGASGRKAATLTPVEAFGVHPPGLAPADAKHSGPYVPYYAPLAPVASSTRWRPWAYYPLLPFYTPYYLGYCPHRLFNPPPRPYGSDGWGKGPKPEQPLPEEPGTTPLVYGPYTSIIEDDTTFWNMGGNGLVPYGAAAPVEARPADLVDAIQASRPRGRRHARFGRAAPAGAPAIVSPLEGADDPRRYNDQMDQRSRQPMEQLPPGEAVPGDQGDVGRDRSSRRTRSAEAIAHRPAVVSASPAD